MLRTSALLVFSLALSGFAQNATLTVTSAASNSPNLSPESLASAFGTGLAPRTAFADSTPWPTTLGDVTVDVIDSAGMKRSAGLLFVSRDQINFQIPAGTALGLSSVLVHNGSATFSTQVQINTVAPALFSVGNSGIAAATAFRVTIPTHIQSPVPVFICLDSSAGCSLIPIGLGVDSPVYLSLFGTGIRGHSPLDQVVVKIGATSVGAMFAGPQSQFPGLDQVNVALPISLRGAGVVDVTVTAGGVTSNAVRIHIQ